MLVLIFFALEDLGLLHHLLDQSHLEIFGKDCYNFEFLDLLFSELNHFVIRDCIVENDSPLNIVVSFDLNAYSFLLFDDYVAQQLIEGVLSVTIKVNECMDHVGRRNR